MFLDTSSIKPGTKWPDQLAERLRQSETLLVVIGPNWLKTHDEWGRRRIDSEDDWVRHEISYALREGKSVLPVLVGGAVLPPEHALPPELKELSQRQAVDVRRDYWEHDVELILSVFEEKSLPLAEPSGQSEPKSAASTDPFVVFEYDLSNGWKIRNIGGGPALDVLVSERRFEGSWIQPIRIPPLAAGEERWLKWVHHRNLDVLGARYCNAANRVFSTVCQHDNSTVQSGSVFPNWTETDIRAQWRIGA